MSDAERRALELYPPKHIRETWVRADPDINAPLRAAYVKGWNDAQNKKPILNNSKL
jgi:hypothetical protein